MGAAWYFDVLLLSPPDPNYTNLLRLFTIEPVQKRQIKGDLRPGFSKLAA
jgi:hypothetical protein